MIDGMGFPDNSEKTYPSESHKKVAHLLLCKNPRITSRMILIDQMNIICNLSLRQVEMFTPLDFVSIGILL